MQIEGLGAWKDFKLYPGGGSEWDRAQNRDQAFTWLQPADDAELLAHGATTIVPSQGMDKQLQADSTTS